MVAIFFAGDVVGLLSFLNKVAAWDATSLCSLAAGILLLALLARPIRHVGAYLLAAVSRHPNSGAGPRHPGLHPGNPGSSPSSGSPAI